MAELKEGNIVISDKTTILKLRSLGAGVEESSKTQISLLEGAYFAQKKVIELPFEKIMDEGKKIDPEFENKYVIVKYFRDMGYIVRPSLDGTGLLRLHRKGMRPGEDKTSHIVKVIDRNSSISPNEMFELLSIAGKMRKDLLLAIIDRTKEGAAPQFVNLSKGKFE
ncbi:hypothetical protein HY990_00980 [Candidatus Micrarchaeota archaeon]|nr:hypothetical protein [Candidatus Micrarchaeota archaeon]